MTAKTVCASALVLFVLGAGAIPAQTTSAQPSGRYSTPSDDESDTTQTYSPPRYQLSDYILYNGCRDCCGPVGGNGPINSELFIRTGPSLPVAGGTLRNTLSTGWNTYGGGRVLFFNTCREAAWTAEIGGSYIYNNGSHPNLTLPVGTDTVSIRGLHRTSFQAALGREWYLLGAAGTGERNWRVGADAGGRYGTSRVEMNSLTNASGYRRRYDVDGGVVLSAHTDYEIPIGCCAIQIGLRAEWDYIWSDVLQDSNISDVNLLLNFGLRF